MQNIVDSSGPPRPGQMRELRRLAQSRGETFAYPSTSAEADAELDRLSGRGKSSFAERSAERRAVSRDMAARGGAAAVRDSEIEGWGSSARWAVGK